MFVGTPGFSTSYVIPLPPPPGRLGLRGATMVCAVKSDGFSSVFLKTKKLLNHRRLYVTSTEVRGRICCCTPMPNCQSDGRTPQPLSTAGSMLVSPAVLPNPDDDHGPHSPLAAGFIRLQSGRKFPFESVHVRLTVVWKFGPMRPLRPSIAGLEIVWFCWLFAPCRYFPRFTRTDVLPLPMTSQAAPMRGVMSLNALTPLAAGNVIGAGLYGPGSGAPLWSAGKKLQARSYRTAPCNVSRPSVH